MIKRIKGENNKALSLHFARSLCVFLLAYGGTAYANLASDKPVSLSSNKKEKAFDNITFYTKEELATRKLQKLAQPITRVEPTYPKEAKAKGIEGWVILEFSRAMDGTVKNIRILDAYPKGVFDDSAKDALEQWKYAPQPLSDLTTTVELTFSL
ncbi:energy transducer TonB [Alteromonas sediminis]|uniref:Protein TonB n=1 Tax=Alteromonas sediminis TaxID=2259342 RepID=A0A3N5XWV6_9ALTE|nr:energy transducer TonB [Alteromonas sediminis]RPJ64900.1 energy transducer TonB [Alteromonas sediminis]